MQTLTQWACFGKIFEFNVKDRENNIRRRLAEPLTDLEEETEFGPLDYIYETYKSIFKYHGCASYTELEDAMVILLKEGIKLKAGDISTKKIDLLAKLDTVEMRAKTKAGVITLHLYITQKISNCVAETLGRLSNIFREGVRMKMGMLYLEVYVRLHYLGFFFP